MIDQDDATTFEVEEIHSGLVEECLWVTIGFVSPENPFDALHVVCGTVITDEDRRTGMADLYVERTDQGEACYGGAASLRVSDRRIDFELTAEGQRELRLPESVRFLLPAGLEGAAEAVETFARMAALEPRRVIEVTPGVPPSILPGTVEPA